MLGRLETACLSTSVANRPASAPTRWLLLRGLGRERRHWFDFPEVLAARLGVEVRCIDLPGMGERQSERVPYSIHQIARNVRWQFAAEHPERFWGVLGISLGGMVAVSLASQWQRGVSHLVVINSSSRRSLPHERLRPRAVAHLLRAAVARNVEDRERRIYALTTNAAGPRVASWVLRAAELGRESPAPLGALACQLLAAARFDTSLVTQPALVLSGAKDRLVSPVCSSALARALGAEHHSHPSAGHDLPLEEPDWVIEQMRSWLASIELRGD